MNIDLTKRRLSDAEFASLTAIQKRLMSTEMSRAINIDELKEDVCRLLTARWDSVFRGASFNELNRRFGMKAAEFKWTARRLCFQMDAEGLIEFIEVGRTWVALPKGWALQLKEDCLALPESERTEALLRIQDETLKASLK